VAAGDERRQRGADGQDKVAAWYEREGYEVLDRSWHCNLGSLDLVCASGPLLVVCAVRTKKPSGFGSAAESLNAAEQRRQRELGARWLAEHPVGCDDVRHDVATVVGDRVSVAEEAF
jgi:putative endonuclease